MTNIYNIGFPDDDGGMTPPIKQGSTFRLPFTVTNIFANGGAGCLIRGQYRTSYGAADAVDFDCEITETTEDLLTCMAELSADIAADMVPGKGVYDIEIEDTSGFVFRAMEGKAKVSPEVTK